MNRSLSITEWHRLALTGTMLPVRIQLRGYSMNPLIRGFKDYVTILPLNDDPETGDIVLFSEPGTGRYIVHRVWDQKDGQVLTWGDNCAGPDGWMPKDVIWGKIKLIERGRRKIQPDCRKGMKWAQFWHQAGKVYRPCRQFKIRVIRRLKKLIRSAGGKGQR